MCLLLDLRLPYIVCLFRAISTVLPLFKLRCLCFCCLLCVVIELFPLFIFCFARIISSLNLFCLEVFPSFLVFLSWVPALSSLPVGSLLYVEAASVGV